MNEANIPNIIEEMKKNGVSKTIIEKKELASDAVNILSEYISDSEYKTHPSAVLIKLEPVIVDSNTSLFANRVPSPVVNQLTVKSALVDPNDPENYIPGKTIFKTLISESALSQSLINTNSSVYPMTFTEAMGDPLEKTNYFIKSSQEKNELQFKNSIENTVSIIKNALDSIETVVNTKEQKMGKKEANEIIHTLKCATQNLYSNVNYSTKESIKKYQEDVSQILVEADNLIKRLNIYSNMNNVETLMLENKKNQDSTVQALEKMNPLKLFLNGIFTNEDMKEIYEKVPTIEVGYSNRDLAKNYNNFINRYENKHITKNVSLRHEANGCIRFSRISTNEELNFSSFGFNGGELMQIEINSAVIEPNESNDKEYIYEQGVVARISMTPSDFLLFIRGNSKSDFVPCELSSFCGKLIKSEKINKTEDENIADKYKVEVSEGVSGLSKTLFSLMENGIKTQKAKNQIKDAKKAYLEAIKNDCKELEHIFKNANNENMNVAKKHSQKTLEKLDNAANGKLKNVNNIFKIESKKGD